jgi:hypothetical protein
VEIDTMWHRKEMPTRLHPDAFSDLARNVADAWPKWLPSCEELHHEPGKVTFVGNEFELSSPVDVCLQNIASRISNLRGIQSATHVGVATEADHEETAMQVVEAFNEAKEDVGVAAVGAEGDIADSGERPEDIAMHDPGSDGIPRYTRLP